MLALPFYLLLPVLALWSVYELLPVAWYFFGATTLVVGWALIVQYSVGSTASLQFSADETIVFKQHKTYFLYPAQARMISSTFSVVQVSALLVGGSALFRQEWLIATLAVIAFFGCSNLVPIFNPGHFLRYHSARGKLTPELESKLSLVEAIEEKVQRRRGGA